MITILSQRCGCPPTYARKLVEIMDALRCRRSKSGVFLGKDGFITPRDLLRWAERGASTKQDLARDGYMILAERLRTNDEKECVKETIEEHLKVQIDVESMYYGVDSEALRILNEVHNGKYDNEQTTALVDTIAPTRSLLRLVTLVLSAIKQKEPVLLVGGKYL
jgi:midasin